LLPLSLRLLLLRGLIGAGLPTATHSPQHRTDSGTLAGITGYRTNCQSTQSATCSAEEPFATANCRS
jgi:hypothetical protein